MRRSSLLMLTVLGSLICLIGSTGLFAALTDTARSGTNSVDSGALAASADIQIATASVPGTTPPNWVCGAFTEDLATGFFAASNVSPGYGSGGKVFCLRNIGSQPVTVTANATDLVDVEVACSGDEALFDGTCGDGHVGELSSVLTLTYSAIRCADGALLFGPHTLGLGENTTTPADLGNLAPNQALCYTVAVAYPSATSPGDVQAAQSDRVTWRIDFTGHA